VLQPLRSGDINDDFVTIPLTSVETVGLIALFGAPLISQLTTPKVTTFFLGTVVYGFAIGLCAAERLAFGECLTIVS